MIYAFIYGIFLALGLIVPLGIQNIFIFNQGANQPHFWRALPSVITAVICDTILILCAVLGISVVVFAIPWLKMTILIIGFCFLAYMGLVTWYARPLSVEPGQKPLSAKGQILFAASVSLLNPHALLDTIGVIGTSSLQFVGQEKIFFTAGAILISIAWFFGLSVAGHFLHKLDRNGRYLQIINKCSALIIWAIALYIAWLIFSSSVATIMP